MKNQKNMEANAPKINPALVFLNKNAYKPQRIERKWQKIWKKTGLFTAEDFSSKKKFYCLDMFPYPSGEGLHVGHPRGYVATDVFSHLMRRQGFNVMHPMGWDAFGLPAENYAIKTGIQPRISTAKNIKNFRRQIKSLGLSYDWSREINTTDPDYYRFTQKIFLMLYKHGLAYEAEAPINWCPSCKTGLANEEVVEGKCERCHSEVGRKNVRQWILKITAYAERLLKDLEELDWPERIKEMQRHWIGRSQGWEIKFNLKTQTETLNYSADVFTTRADTLFGATYLVLAPEHPLLEDIKDKITNYRLVKKYIEEAKNKSERERISEVKQKTGIGIKGLSAINPINGREIALWVADYVLIHYGTGAIMAVPSHDQRDFDFAKTHNLPIIEVIKPVAGEKKLPKEAKPIVSSQDFEAVYEGEGVLINSGRFNGLNSKIAAERIGAWLAKKDLAKKAIHYKLRDWVFSRQRYWGEPIPIVRCQKCGLVPLPENELPLKLPKVEKYQPTGTGESPLATINEWVEVKCPQCGGPAKRETNTMPQWAGSCWYYVAYTLGDWRKKKEIRWDKKKIAYWLPVDLYVGGAEHAVLHLLYARFWHKFLFDQKLVSTKEPFMKLKNVGLVLGPDGQKMSKSRGNVISPDETINKYGADTLRLYEMFMGPFSQETAWSLQGIKGCRRFLERVWQMRTKTAKVPLVGENSALKRLLNQTIKKTGEEVKSFRFNTAVSGLMILANELEKQKEISLEEYKTLLLLLAPFAPHLTENLWQALKEAPPKLKDFAVDDSIHRQPWPKYDEKFMAEAKIILAIQVNGKFRDQIEVGRGITKGKTEELALKSEKVAKWLMGKEIKKMIFIPNRLLNIVI